MSRELQIHVAGKGVSEKPVTRRLAVVRLISGVLLCAGLFALMFFSLGWGFFIERPSTSAIALCAALLFLSFVATVIFLRSGPCLKLFGLKRSRAQKGKVVFAGYTSESARFFSKIAVCIYGVSSIVLFWKIFFVDFPIPSELRILAHTSEFSAPNADSFKNATPDQRQLLPITFWDYVFWIDPMELEQLHILVPYEKGPPKKLLSKVTFLNKETGQIQLELSGKRPRSYAQEDVKTLFIENLLSPRFRPQLWKPLYQLVHEAGLGQAHSDFRLNLPFYWFEIRRVGAPPTQAVGLPWEGFQALDAPIPTKYSGRFFFLSPAGGVFQVRCPAPCALANWLERLYFLEGDPRKTFAARKEWTLQILRGLLSNPQQMAQNKNLVLMYLVSMLSLDPRDPEAYFHLGKLASHPQTLQSAIRFGKDVGLDPPRIAELESMAQNLRASKH